MRLFRCSLLLSIILATLIVSPVWGQSDQEVTSGILAVGNGFYQVYVDAATGKYTAATAAQHPSGAALNVLYGGNAGSPDTSFNTVRSFTSMTDYVQGTVEPTAGFQTVDLSWFTPRSQQIDGNAIRTRYLLDPLAEGSAARDAMEIIQDVRVIGSNQFNSAVQVTTRITNMGENDLKIGVRYLWDFEIGLDDGPAFAAQNPDSGEINTEVEYLAPQFRYFRMQDNDQNASSPILSVLGTVNNQGGFNPPATTPSLLRNACYMDASRLSFEYTINPQRDINTPASDCRGSAGGDGAVLYYFGHEQQTAYTITDSETRVISAYIFLNPPPPADNTDTDGDGLLDTWEVNGIDVNNDGTIDVRLEGVNPNRKDILIYYDWTANADGTESNKPRSESLELVRAAFANAPVSNPDGSTGITLHFREGRAVTTDEDHFLGYWDGWFYSWQEFADIKAANFPAELWPFYHYTLFATQHAQNHSSGRSRNSADFGAGSSDLFVTIGSWGRDIPDWVQIEAGTIMHELGHNLGLGHGGIDIHVNEDGTQTVYPSHENQKPNHLSIMSYSFQTQGLPTTNGNIIDYSRFGATDLPDLDETALSETTWVGARTAAGDSFTLNNAALSSYSTHYYCPDNTIKTVTVSTNVDWNCDNEFATAAISANIDATDNQMITTANEWDNLVYTGGAIGGLGSALDLPLVTDTRLAPEPTLIQHEALRNNVLIPFDTALIVNGDFEDPANVQINDFLNVADNTILPGWRLVNGNVDIVGTLWQASSGQRSLHLGGSTAGTIQQSVPTEVGQTYALRFALSGYPLSEPAVKTLQVEITGQPEPSVFSVDTSSRSASAMQWTYETITFTATEPVTVISFSTALNSFGPVIDQVSLDLATATASCVADVTLANELNDAIMAANAGTGCSTIRLNADIPLGQLTPAFPGEAGDNAFPIITSTIVIDGNGYTISRVNAVSDFRFFEVNGRDGNLGNLTLRNMTLAGGQLLDAGAVLVDGSRGGNASITIDQVTFRSNTSNGNGGALAALSYNGGQVTTIIRNTQFQQNSGVYGGAIYIGGFDNGNNTTQITNTSFTDNVSTGGGGAVYNNGLGSGGKTVMTVDGSQFENNRTDANGGAIYNNGSRGGNATLTVTNSRFVNNTAAVGSAIASDGSENGTALVQWDDNGEMGNGIVCLTSDASGVLQRDDACSG
jgi:choice-of-anchor C domain-containing protein